MLDPATIGLAIAGVRTTAELVKKGIAAAKDVNDSIVNLEKSFEKLYGKKFNFKKVTVNDLQKDIG